MEADDVVINSMIATPLNFRQIERQAKAKGKINQQQTAAAASGDTD